jgi:RNA polymerase sigma-54 factor
MNQLHPRLDQRAAARQTIGLAPAQQQSIKLLEMSNLALAELVAEVLAENPLLEPAAELPAAAPRRRRPPRAAPARALPAGLARLWSAATPARRTSGGGGEADGIAALAAAGPTLHEHLMQQLGADVADPIDRAIGRGLIETVDEAGYLTGDITELAERLGHPVSRVEAVLARLQEFDPPGVGARNLTECLTLQLADRGRLDAPMQTLLGHLDLFANGDRATLMQRCGIDAGRLAAMIAELRRLDPRPGLAFDGAAAVAVTPDIVIERGPDGAWRVDLNDESLPRLALNEGYSVGGDPAARAYLRERRAAAHWLLRALDRRAETLLRVAGEIVRRQQGFLEGGPGELQPLSRREVAGLLGLHESTVGRATSNKYAETPRGVLALADFFGGRLAERAEDAGHAPAAVRARLRRLIEAETAGRPLSDGRLAELLRADGIAIARRTVAKYREVLGVLPSSKRKRYY